MYFDELDPKDVPKHIDALIKECLEKCPDAIIAKIDYCFTEE